MAEVRHSEVLTVLSQIIGVNPLTAPSDTFDLYDAVTEAFWARLDAEFRPAIEAQLQQELARYRNVHGEEIARYRAGLRDHLDALIASQLHDSEAGVRAVEQARDLIVKRLNADPDLGGE